MKLDKEELYKFAYIKKPLNEIYKDSSSVPQEFLRLTPEQIFEWLEDAMTFVWETKKR